MKSKRNILILWLLCLLINFSLSAVERPGREHNIYFGNTPNELNVYKIYGHFDGNTIFILGGIQGDEPGGFLSADLYPDLHLEKGNLIVIPRANFHSIIKNNRKINFDMNRRFANDSSETAEDKIVKIIKSLMTECDMFLNLHDGWGFYSDTWQSEGRNPDRYGQSIIADDSIYIADGDTIWLKKMALQALSEANKKITNPKHHLNFLNTHTFNKDDKYKGMNKSATFYALTHLGIPAFGIETSKNLPKLEDKIRYHNYAINEFMKIMGVEPEYPAIIYEPPKLIYLLISINNSDPKLVDDNHTLNVSKGDKIKIIHIESNYKRGLSCNVYGVGSESDFNKSLVVDKSTKVEVKRDNTVIGNINIKINEINSELTTYIFEVNGEKRAVLDGQSLNIVRGDKIRIIEVLAEGIPSDFLVVNLKGFVPETDYNKGEDRKYLIDSSELTWKKWSVYGKGKVFPIIVKKNNRIISKATISIEEKDHES